MNGLEKELIEFINRIYDTTGITLSLYNSNGKSVGAEEDIDVSKMESEVTSDKAENRTVFTLTTQTKKNIHICNSKRVFIPTESRWTYISWW